MLWTKKYCPGTLNELTHATNLTKKLKLLAKTGNVPNILFYGVSGSGKTTRIRAFLRALFGSEVDNLNVEINKIKNGSKNWIEISFKTSIYHIEINPSQVGNNDRFVVKNILQKKLRQH